MTAFIENHRNRQIHEIDKVLAVFSGTNPLREPQVVFVCGNDAVRMRM
jgi:hypothetical protein